MLELREGRILIADDDPAIRSVVLEILDIEGYKGVEAGNGLEALDVLKSTAVDGILLDVNMPLCNGSQFRENQLQIPDKKDVPVVVVSASYKGIVPENLKALPKVDKPFDYTDLVNQIERTFFSNKIRSCLQI